MSYLLNHVSQTLCARTDKEKCGWLARALTQINSRKFDIDAPLSCGVTCHNDVWNNWLIAKMVWTHSKILLLCTTIFPSFIRPTLATFHLCLYNHPNRQGAHSPWVVNTQNSPLLHAVPCITHPILRCVRVQNGGEKMNWVALIADHRKNWVVLLALIGYCLSMVS